MKASVVTAIRDFRFRENLRSDQEVETFLQSNVVLATTHNFSGQVFDISDLRWAVEQDFNAVLEYTRVDNSFLDHNNHCWATQVSNR